MPSPHRRAASYRGTVHVLVGEDIYRNHRRKRRAGQLLCEPKLGFKQEVTSSPVTCKSCLALARAWGVPVPGDGEPGRWVPPPWASRSVG